MSRRQNAHAPKVKRGPTIVSAASNEQKTKVVLEWWGYRSGLTTWLQRGSNYRRDLFGFVDMVAVSQDHTGFLCIQATKAGHVNARVQKITKECELAALDVLSGLNRIEVWGWKYYKKIGWWDAKRVEVYDVTSDRDDLPKLTTRVLPTYREEEEFRVQFGCE